MYCLFCIFPGILFVVDSTDTERLDEAQDLLEELLCHEELTGTPVVVVANKQDIEGIHKMGVGEYHKCRNSSKI